MFIKATVFDLKIFNFLNVIAHSNYIDSCFDKWNCKLVNMLGKMWLTKNILN